MAVFSLPHVGALLVVFISGGLVLNVAARDVPTLTCENSEAGRHYLADSRGYVCSRAEFDYTSGCCDTGEQYSCETCHEEDKCCSSYEHCVSCCMKPEHGAGDLAKKQYRIHNHQNTGYWDTAFQFCLGKCRTHKRSTVHENAFIDERHFCFSDSSRPKTDDPPPQIPEGISVHAGKKGADCATTCTNKGLFCAPEHAHAIAFCDIMRDHFECEAGCAPNPEAKESPAYVVYGTPKPLYPTMCFILDPAASAGAPPPSCTASQPHMRRLCSCSHQDPAADTVAAEAGDASDGSSTDIQWVEDSNGAEQHTQNRSEDEDVAERGEEVVPDDSDGDASGDDDSSMSEQQRLRGEIVNDDGTGIVRD